MRLDYVQQHDHDCFRIKRLIIGNQAAVQFQISVRCHDVFERAEPVVQLVQVFQHFCLVLFIHHFMTHQHFNHTVNGIIQYNLDKLLLSCRLQSAEVHDGTELIVVFFPMEAADFTVLHKPVKPFRFHSGRVRVTHLIFHIFQCHVKHLSTYI